jgi:hypothetical protein
MVSNNLEKRLVSLTDLKKLVEDSLLFAVLDACEAPEVLKRVAEVGSDRAVCLFRGKLESEILAVAPYLIRVDNSILDWLVKTFWDEPCGIFIIAKSNLTKMQKHLRKFLVVNLPGKEIAYFRFYDPRVLRSFLSTCLKTELREFYGPIEAFGVQENHNAANTAGEILLLLEVIS